MGQSLRCLIASGEAKPVTVTPLVKYQYFSLNHSNTSKKVFAPIISKLPTRHCNGENLSSNWTSGFIIKLEKKKSLCFKPQGGRGGVLIYILGSLCIPDCRDREIHILSKT